MAERAVTFNILTKDEQTKRALNQLQRELAKTDRAADQVGRTGSKVGGLLGGLALGAGAMFAVDEAEQAEKVNRKLEAAIAATGNAAGITADEYRAEADALGKKIAVDNDDIIALQAKLTAYKNIKGEKFHETIAVAADVAAAKEKDLATVSEQLGKALNSPAQAAKLLRSMGVALTDQQKRQIEVMVEAGDVAGAQGLILDELKARYSGAAEANVTDSQRMKVAMADAAESVGRILTPAMEKVADVTVAAADAFGSLPQPVQTAALALGAMAVVAKKMEDRITAADGSLTSLSGGLSTVDKGLVAATAGVASFTAATAALNELSDFDGDIQSLSDNMLSLAAGSSDVGGALDGLGGSAEAMADKFRLADKSVLGSWNKGGIAGIRKAQSDIDALDDSLAALVESGRADEARIAYNKLEAALVDQGIAAEDVRKYLDDYGDAAWRSERAANDSAKAAERDADAKRASAAAGRAAADADGAWNQEQSEQIQTMMSRLALQQQINDETAEAIALAGDAASAELALKAAQDSVQDSMIALADARRDGSTEQRQRAEDQLTAAVLREVDAADELARKTAEAEGRQYGAAASAEVQRRKLEELRRQTGLNNETLRIFGDRLEWAAAARTVKLDTAEFDAKLANTLKVMERMAVLAGSLGLETANGSPVRPGAYNADRQDRAAPRRSAPGVTINIHNATIGPRRRELADAVARADRERGRRRIAS